MDHGPNQVLTLTPSDFVAFTNQAIQHAMPFVVIEGELAEVRIRKEKWLYCKLKDDYATVPCFGTVFNLPGPVEEGMTVRVSGSPRMHPQFGFSFQVQNIALAGEGTIKKALDMLTKKLSSEGLFDEDRKRQLPYPPQKIALVTSAESAAIADFKKILKSRWPLVEVMLQDSLVQGDSAPGQLVSAIEKFNSMSSLADVLVVIRGGGSAEDLSAFNDERVVRAIAASRVPTLVAIGHENDLSLSELAADLKASTPSNAAELLVPDKASEKQWLLSASDVLKGGSKSMFDKQKRHLDESSVELVNAIQSLLQDESRMVTDAGKVLSLSNPENLLKRGYSLVRKNKKLIRSSKDLAGADKVEVTFSDGKQNMIVQ